MYSGHRRGVGKGGVRRHRKHFRGCVQEISNYSIRKLARRANVQRISGSVCEQARTALRMFLEKVVHDAVRYAEYSKRQTITVTDCVHSLKRVWQYGSVLIPHENNGTTRSRQVQTAATLSTSLPTPTSSTLLQTPTLTKSHPTQTLTKPLPVPTLSMPLPTQTLLTSLPVPTSLTSLPTPTLSTSLPASTLSTSLSASTLPKSLPTTTLSTTLSKSKSPTLLSASTLPTSILAPTSLTSLPTPTLSTSLPASTLSKSLPTTTLTTTLSKSKSPTLLSASTLPTSIPAPTSLTSLPTPTLSTSLSASALSKSLPVSTFSTSLQTTMLSTSLPASTMSTSLSASTLSTSLPAPTKISIEKNTSVAKTRNIEETPAKLKSSSIEETSIDSSSSSKLPNQEINLHGIVNNSPAKVDNARKTDDVEKGEKKNNYDYKNNKGFENVPIKNFNGQILSTQSNRYDELKKKKIRNKELKSKKENYKNKQKQDTKKKHKNINNNRRKLENKKLCVKINKKVRFLDMHINSVEITDIPKSSLPEQSDALLQPILSSPNHTQQSVSQKIGSKKTPPGKTVIDQKMLYNVVHKCMERINTKIEPQYHEKRQNSKNQEPNKSQHDPFTTTGDVNQKNPQIDSNLRNAPDNYKKHFSQNTQNNVELSQMPTLVSTNNTIPTFSASSESLTQPVNNHLKRKLDNHSSQHMQSKKFMDLENIEHRNFLSFVQLNEQNSINPTNSSKTTTSEWNHHSSQQVHLKKPKDSGNVKDHNSSPVARNIHQTNNYLRNTSPTDINRINHKINPQNKQSNKAVPSQTSNLVTSNQSQLLCALKNKLEHMLDVSLSVLNNKDSHQIFLPMGNIQEVTIPEWNSHSRHLEISQQRQSYTDDVMLPSISPETLLPPPQMPNPYQHKPPDPSTNLTATDEEVILIIDSAKTKNIPRASGLPTSSQITSSTSIRCTTENQHSIRSDFETPSAFGQNNSLQQSFCSPNSSSSSGRTDLKVQLASESQNFPLQSTCSTTNSSGRKFYNTEVPPASGVENSLQPPPRFSSTEAGRTDSNILSSSRITNFRPKPSTSSTSNSGRTDTKKLPTSGSKNSLHKRSSSSSIKPGKAYSIVPSCSERTDSTIAATFGPPPYQTLYSSNNPVVGTINPTHQLSRSSTSRNEVTDTISKVSERIDSKLLHTFGPPTPPHQLCYSSSESANLKMPSSFRAKTTLSPSNTARKLENIIKQLHATSSSQIPSSGSRRSSEGTDINDLSKIGQTNYPRQPCLPLPMSPRSNHGSILVNSPGSSIEKTESNIPSTLGSINPPHQASRYSRRSSKGIDVNISPAIGPINTSHQLSHTSRKSPKSIPGWGLESLESSYLTVPYALRLMHLRNQSALLANQLSCPSRRSSEETNDNISSTFEPANPMDQRSHFTRRSSGETNSFAFVPRNGAHQPSHSSCSVNGNSSENSSGITKCNNPSTFGPTSATCQFSHNKPINRSESNSGINYLNVTSTLGPTNYFHQSSRPSHSGHGNSSRKTDPDVSSALTRPTNSTFQPCHSSHSDRRNSSESSSRRTGLTVPHAFGPKIVTHQLSHSLYGVHGNSSERNSWRHYSLGPTNPYYRSSRSSQSGPGNSSKKTHHDVTSALGPKSSTHQPSHFSYSDPKYSSETSSERTGLSVPSAFGPRSFAHQPSHSLYGVPGNSSESNSEINYHSIPSTSGPTNSLHQSSRSSHSGLEKSSGSSSLDAPSTFKPKSRATYKPSCSLQFNNAEIRNAIDNDDTQCLLLKLDDVINSFN